MVTIPIDVEVVVDDAVAARLVEKVVYIVRHGIVEYGVEGKPRQLVLGDAVADGSVAAGDDVEDKGDDAVLSVAACIEEGTLSLLVE